MKKHGAVAAHYPTLKIPEIAKFPVWALAHPEACALFMWATGPKLPEAIVLMALWGFRYATKAFTWVKTYEDGTPIVGLGNYSRSDNEILLLGIRGEGMTKLRLDAGVRETVHAPRAEHSKKPAVFHEKIEALFPGPYVELFARSGRPGWDAFGNEKNVDYTVRLETP